MDSSTAFQLKINALEIIKTYRVPDLQVIMVLKFSKYKYLSFL